LAKVKADALVHQCRPVSWHEGHSREGQEGMLSKIVLPTWGGGNTTWGIQFYFSSEAKPKSNEFCASRAGVRNYDLVRESEPTTGIFLSVKKTARQAEDDIVFSLPCWIILRSAPGSCDRDPVALP
jgi:hypothetical protein